MNLFSQRVPMRFSFTILFALASLGACDDAPCRPNEFKVGMVCYKRMGHDGGEDLAPGETGKVNEDDGGSSGAHAGDAGTDMDATSELGGAHEAAEAGKAASDAATSESVESVDGAAAQYAPADTGPACVASAEVCDSKDNDCDGVVDNLKTLYADCDGDGYYSGAALSCLTPGAAKCVAGSMANEPPSAAESDCFDQSSAAYPGARFGWSVDGFSDLNCNGLVERQNLFGQSGGAWEHMLTFWEPATGASIPVAATLMNCSIPAPAKIFAVSDNGQVKLLPQWPCSANPRLVVEVDSSCNPVSGGEQVYAGQLCK